MAEIDERAPTFEPPGPGGWRIDRGHGAEPASLASQEVHLAAFAPGFRDFTGRYGLALSHIEGVFLHGYGYGSPRIAGVPPSDSPPPPDWLLRVLVRVHPTMVRRSLRARRALARRTWVDELRRWDEEARPARVARNLAVQAVDPSALDDHALAEHVDDAGDAFVEGMTEHFAFVGAGLIPVGLYLQRELDRGVDPGEALCRVDRSASEQGVIAQQRALAEACTAAGVAATSLDAIRLASPEASRLLDAYLTEHGQRLTGFDLAGPRLVELRQLVAGTIRAAQVRPVATGPSDADGTDDDPLLHEARQAQRSRNERAGTCALWPGGLYRRALLEAGGRLAASGALDDVNHVFDARRAEITGLLRGASAPTASEIASRHAARLAAADLDPPETLGPQHPPPDTAVFPRSLSTVTSAVMMTVMRADRPATAVDTGIGIGTAPVRGRAIVVESADAGLDRLEAGDVLVTATTTPVFDSLLALAGGLVTEEGGLTSHAAITSRDLGLTAVVGLPDACAIIPDGADIELDPIAGTVTVLA